MAFDFDTAIDRSGTASLKWDRYQGRDVIPLWVADMDFPAPREVVEALLRRVQHPIFGYTIPTEKLTRSVQSWLIDRYDWQVESDWLVWLPGVVSGFNIACRSVGAPGDDVLCPTPVYPPFFKAPGLADRRLITVSMEKKDERWGYDFKRFAETISPKTGLFLFCHPHNPTGTVFSKSELDTLASICLKNKVVICSDEIHCDLLLGENSIHLPMAAIDPEIADQTITLMAPSKTFNIPGLEFSFAVISNPELRKRFLGVMEGIVPRVNIFGYEAAIAAYDCGWEWLISLRRYLTGNLGIVENAVSQITGLSMTRPEATYLAWIDATGLNVPDPHAYFEKAGVGLSDGKDFGMPGYVRLNFGCTKALLLSALDRMERAVSVI
jgi:cysteine-S-conjugate beta-lyase